MVKVVIINGLATVGKSTFCKDCEIYCNTKYQNVKSVELSTVDFVKEVAKYCGWDGVKDEKGRQFLHELKMSMSRYGNIPTIRVAQKIQEYIDMYPSRDFIFFINARESKDIEALEKFMKDNYGWFVMTLLIRNDKKSVTEVPELVDDIFKPEYDYTIYNEGDLESLYQLAGNFVKDLLANRFAD